MIKIEEINNPKSCLNRAEKFEPVFTLLARDMTAPEVIRWWAHCRVTSGKNKPGDQQLVEAFELADKMEIWRKEWLERNA